MSYTEKIAFVHNSQVPETEKVARSLIMSLNLQNRAWICSAGELQVKSADLETTSLVVVVGGDGTILRTIRAISSYNAPVVGINMGKVGFMAELSPREALERLPEFIDFISRGNEKIRVEQRMMLEADIIPAGQNEPRLSVHALNDVTVGTSTVSRLIELNTSVNHVHLTNYRADAVIVSTATGSTGYALSAGGPIVFPEAQMMILQPVAAHTGLRDGLILAPDSVVELEASKGYQASVSADGFVDSQLEPGERVAIRKSPYSARFLRAHQPDFFYTALNMRLGLAYRSQRPPEEPDF